MFKINNYNIDWNLCYNKIKEKYRMLPNFKELTIPSKYQSRKNFINFVEKLIEEEICIYLKIKKEEVKTVILTPNLVVVLQRKLDKFLKEYTVYTNLISESSKLNKEDPRYFKINELESFEEITDKITKVSIINKVKNFANKLLRSYSNLLYKEDGSLNENIIEKFSVIMEENLEKEKLSELFSNIKIVAGNKEGFSALLDKIIRSFNPVKQDILDLIKNENINAVVKHDENNVVVLQINDFNASEKLGNNKWCISNDKDYFENYLINSEVEIAGLVGSHYFVYDFKLNKDDNMSHYAFTVNFNGEITAAFDKRNEEIDDIIVKLFDKKIISKILDPEIKKINDLDNKSCFDIIEKLEELITDSDSNDNYSLSNVFSNTLIANYILKEKTKSETLPEYLLNYRYKDIRKQFTNIDKLNLEDMDIQELFVNSIKYAKKVYESNFNCFLNLEYVLEIISEEDPEFESETLAENPYATEEDLLETAIEYIKTNTYLNLPPHLKDYISYDFNKELLASEDKTRSLYLLSEDKKQELYETFKEDISKVLNQTSLSCFSFIQKKDKGLENNIISILLKQYYIDYEHKLNDKEKSIICATLLKSPDIEDNKFAKEYLNDYLAENIEHFLYHYETQSKVTKKIVIDTLNSEDFKIKVKEDKIKINDEHFTYSLFDRKEVLIALTEETKLFIKENLHPFEVNSMSGRNILPKKSLKEEDYTFDLGKRSVTLINEGLLDMEKIIKYIGYSDSGIMYGDKYVTQPYNSISDYIASNANKVDNTVNVENNTNFKNKKERKINL